MNHPYIFRGAIVALLSFLLAGCQKGSSGELAAASNPAAHNPMEITINEDLLRQIRIGEPKWSEVAGTLRVAGRVEADENRIARVSAPVTGRITELNVVEGQNVHKGQVLAVIHSTQLADEQSSYLKARSQKRLAERAVGRAKLLLEAGVIGEAELQRREAEVAQAAVDLSTSRDQLRVLGMSEETLSKLETAPSISSFSQVVASIEGTVLERKATIGQVMQAAEIVCVLADLSNVWLVADVPEQAAGTVDIGKTVEAEIPALPGITVRGKLTFVSATVNPETRTVRIRMDLKNPHRRFKPAMLATVMLSDNTERKQVVPETAVVREGNQDHVFIQTGERSFLLRQVTLGAEFGKQCVLADGVRPGEKIVLDGAFHLNNERKRLATQGS
ncbi:MAG: efflux RND transporter periplasmic adaptor subunit [Bryobacterales bacterium]|nr:efflux RND transporter periplasmic adaptor subunit [Bryobacterales bacterium]